MCSTQLPPDENVREGEEDRCQNDDTDSDIVSDWCGYESDENKGENRKDQRLDLVKLGD